MKESEMAKEIGASTIMRYGETASDTQALNVAECLVDLSRKTQPHGPTRVDNAAVISIELAAEVSLKAFPLKTYHAPPGSILGRPSQGQLGFIRGTRIRESSPGGRPQYKVTPITAKHNLRHIRKEDNRVYNEDFDAILTESYRNWDPESKMYPRFRDMNWIPTVDDRFTIRGERSDNPMIWPFGIDVSRGDTITSYTQGVTGAESSFECVGSDFHFEVGQKIGIAIFSEHRPTKETASYDPECPMNYSPDLLRTVFGEENQVNIYTGKILLVGDTHIEHDINSFKGLSGATIFLLDEEQPSSVATHHFGKAIAVHAGSHPSIRTRNIGFKINNTQFR